MHIIMQPIIIISVFDINNYDAIIKIKIRNKNWTRKTHIGVPKRSEQISTRL